MVGRPPCVSRLGLRQALLGEPGIRTTDAGVDLNRNFIDHDAGAPTNETAPKRGLYAAIS